MSQTSIKPLIREAKRSEWASVADLTQAAYAEYETGSDPIFWERYVRNTRETLLTDESSVRLLAEVNNELAACVLLCDPYERNLEGRIVKNIFPEMRLLAVHPRFRNQALGALLIDECERRVRAKGFEYVTLHTTSLMTTAKAMYERRGYERYELIDFEPVPNFIVWGYRKELS